MTEITFKGSRDMNTTRIDQLRGQPTETGDAGRHIRERGFDKQYYLDLIIALVREHGPVSRKEIDQVLIPKLPDRLTDAQKRSRVSNLIQALRCSNLIVNRGTRAQPAWELTDAHLKNNSKEN